MNVLDKIKLFIFDMDGTIFKGSNFWLELHKEYGNADEALAFYIKHELLSYPSLFEKMVKKYWKGKSAILFEEVIRTREYNYNVVNLHKLVKGLGIKTAIITSGPQMLAQRAQCEMGVNYIYANEIEVKEGKFTGECSVVVDNNNKLEIAEKLIQDLQINWSEVGFIGDAENDIGIAGKTYLSIAYNSKSNKLERNSLYVFDDEELYRFNESLMSKYN